MEPLIRQGASRRWDRIATAHWRAGDRSGKGEDTCPNHREPAMSEPSNPSRRRWLRRTIGVGLLGLTATAFAIDFDWLFDAPAPQIEVSERARRLHRSAIVIDLHADALLWRRDLRRRNRHGHVDFPRLREGGVDAQAITLASLWPIGLNAIRNRWPPRTWTRPWERVRYQMERLAHMLEGRDDVALVRTAAELRANAARGVISLFHGIEGAHALPDGDLSKLDWLAEHGVLFVAPVHLEDNAYGHHGGGDPERGLTELGRRLIDRMNELGLLVDTAHAGSRTLQEAVRRSAFPPINSHTGVKAVRDHWRNISDDDIRAIAARDGVIGIMFGGMALDHPRIDEILAHMQHVIDLVGDRYVALGSDWDGWIRPAVDPAGLPQLTEAMVRRGWSEARIRRILGENVLRVWESRDRLLAARRSGHPPAPRPEK
ncbi:MAG: peptidase M19 [Planctomycetota bacterium]|nr:MAG: peptidase M19 [Planctomycetota bacterium]